MGKGSTSSIASSISSRVNQMVADAEAGDAAAETASASDGSVASPPSGETSGAESVSAASEVATGEGSTTSTTPETPTAATPSAPNNIETKTKHELMQEKLAALREQRQSQRLGAKARDLTAQAEEDRKAAAAERAKWESLKNGTFLEGMRALGKDPRTAFEEMKEEARRAGTPEAMLEAMQSRFDKQISEVVEPLKKRVEELTEREKQLAAREAMQGVQRDFSTTIEDPAYENLRIEYDDAKLFGIVRSMIDEPKLFYRHAKDLGFKLTRADGRFTMKDVLDVIKAAQDEHDRGKETRRAKLKGAQVTQQAAPASADTKTVNGTTDRRNAGSALGNDLATQRAADAPDKPRLSRKQRVQKLIAGG